MANMWPPDPRQDNVLLRGPLLIRPGDNRQFKLWHHDSRGENLQRELHGYGGDRAAWFWKRMDPHLERRADGVGLLVDGRVAQAFVRDCAPYDLAVWNWGADRRGGTVVPWTQVTSGICTSAAVLPPDSLPLVRVMTATGRLEELLDRVGGRRPAIRRTAASALFDVYLLDDTLVYVKAPCVPEDLDAPFFLLVDPIDPYDLPGPRRRFGYDNLDFRFDDHRGSLNGGVCAVEVPLPGYGIEAIRTGQLVEGGFHRLWEGEIRNGAGAGRR